MGQGQELFSSFESRRIVLGEDVQQGCGCCLHYLAVAQVAIEKRSTEKEDLKRYVNVAGFSLYISLNSSMMWNFTWYKWSFI